nr:MAG TPA: hypothetical protein [Caudoviricetes sp.]
MDFRDWMAEVAKAVIVKLTADLIESAIKKKAPKPKRQPKHFEGKGTK